MRRTFIIIIISKFTAVNGNYHGNGKIFQKKIISLFVVLSKKTNQAFKQVRYAMMICKNYVLFCFMSQEKALNKKTIYLQTRSSSRDKSACKKLLLGNNHQPTVRRTDRVRRKFKEKRRQSVEEIES